MVMMFVGGVVLYYSYRRKSTGREFLVPARTLIGVKLLTSYDDCIRSSHFKSANI
jgi:hypothetical protein